MLKKIISVVVAFTLFASMLTACGKEEENVSKPDLKLTEVRGMTTAQLSPEEKNDISHRGNALRLIKEVL